MAPKTSPVCVYGVLAQPIARVQGFKCWYEVSAKENINIHTACNYLVRQMLQQVSRAGDNVSLHTVSEMQSGSIMVRQLRHYFGPSCACLPALSPTSLALSAMYCLVPILIGC